MEKLSHPLAWGPLYNENPNVTDAVEGVNTPVTPCQPLSVKAAVAIVVPSM